MSGFGPFDRWEPKQSCLTGELYSRLINPKEISFILRGDLAEDAPPTLDFFGTGPLLEGEGKWNFQWMDGLWYHYLGRREYSEEIWVHLEKTKKWRLFPSISTSDKPWYREMRQFWEWQTGDFITEMIFREDFLTWEVTDR